MANQKHLTALDRITIENGLKNNDSFKAIAKKLDKDCTTISKEVKKNLSVRKTGAFGRSFNNCLYRYTCKERNSACDNCPVMKSQLCRSCTRCIYECGSYVEEICPRLSKPPYVCNGCPDMKKCTLTKHIYYALEANKKYEERLSESRRGIIITQDEINHLNELLYPLIAQQGQSIHHVYIHHKNEIMFSEKTLYKIIDAGILKVRNIDLPRQVTYKKRKKPSRYKIDSKCMDGRRYEDFKNFIEENPDMPVVQIDTVEGTKGGACLLTVHFTVPTFMIAFRREYNDAQSVIDIFNDIYNHLGRDMFMKLFPVILTDNGPEFSNPEAIEFDEDGNRRTYIFYCHPSSPFEKGDCEVNHEFIRRIAPKGKPFDPYTQKDINLMMSHINSYARPKLNDKTPLFVFALLFSKEVASYFGIEHIDPDKINLTQSLLSQR